MGDKNIRVIRNGGVELLLSSAHAVLHEHRHSPELQPIYLHPASAEVMDVVVKSVQMSTVKAGVVVARDQHLVPVWEITEPLKKIRSISLSVINCVYWFNGTNKADSTVIIWQCV